MPCGRAAGRPLRSPRGRWPATHADPAGLAVGHARRAARVGAGLVRAVELPARRCGAFEPTPPRCSTSRRDHLDWHGDMAPTAPPRRASSASQAVMVVNRDDCASSRWCRRRWSPGPAVAAQPAHRGAQVLLRPGCRSGRATSAWWSRTAWPGWCARPADDPGSGSAPDEDGRSTCTPDAGRRAAHPRPPQRRPMRWPRWRWPPPSAARWRRCCTTCATIAASRTACSSSPAWAASGLRRQQGHQRRRHGGRFRRPGRRQVAGQARRHPGRRRRGPGFLAAAGRCRHSRAVALIGRDAPAIEAVLARPAACRWQRHASLPGGAWCSPDRRRAVTRCC